MSEYCYVCSGCGSRVSTHFLMQVNLVQCRICGERFIRVFDINQFPKKQEKATTDMSEKISELEKRVRDLADRIQRVIDHNDKLEAVIERISELRKRKPVEYDIQCPICSNHISVELHDGQTRVLEGRIVTPDGSTAHVGPGKLGVGECTAGFKQEINPNFERKGVL